MFAEPSRDILLPDPLPPPYHRPYTLVLSLDKLLVHSSWTRKDGWRTVKRPGTDEFLARLSQLYEIVIYTSDPVTFGEPVLLRLDPAGYISHRLFRDATHYEGGIHMKDLSRLNRDLSKVVHLDTELDAFTLNPRNGVPIPEFEGNLDDEELMKALPLLEHLARESTPDVRDALDVVSSGVEKVPVETVNPATAAVMTSRVKMTETLWNRQRVWLEQKEASRKQAAASKKPTKSVISLGLGQNKAA